MENPIVTPAEILLRTFLGKKTGPDDVLDQHWSESLAFFFDEDDPWHWQLENNFSFTCLVCLATATGEGLDSERIQERRAACVGVTSWAKASGWAHVRSNEFRCPDCVRLHLRKMLAEG